ncbi:hypothetical protein HD554DRAFT_2099129 [Boletus coccyginus]|nr:hypothetical protein HD554DRAFT_2099129 [Boletus coccyginus]
MQLLMRDGILYFLVYVPPFCCTFNYPHCHQILLSILLLSTHTKTNYLDVLPCTSRYTPYSVVLLCSGVSAIAINGALAASVVLFLLFFYLIAICSMMPRLIISMRELYDRDLRAHWQGIDTGFGMLSQPISSENAAGSTIAFADVTTGQGQLEEGASEAIRLEESGDDMHQVVGGDADNSEVIRLQMVTDGSFQV